VTQLNVRQLPSPFLASARRAAANTTDGLFATAADEVLVSKTVFKNSGDVEETIDPKGTRTQFTFDHAGRMTKQIEDYGTGKLSRETQFG